MEATIYTKPVERIIEDSSEARAIIARCRWKLNVFNEIFKSINERDNYEFSDLMSFCLGMENICAEIIDKLLDAEGCVEEIEDDIKLCSLDPEKVQQEKENLCSIGFDAVKETQED